MGHIEATINVVLTSEVDKFGILKWCIDASCAVHPDMRGHTGSGLTLGRGSVFNKSTKQKLMTKAAQKWKLLGLMT